MLDYFPAETKYDFSQELFPMLLEKGDPMYGYVADGYWCDVGNLAEFMRANADMLSGEVKVGSFGEQIGEGIWVGEGVEIAPDAQLYGPVYLGDGVKIKQGVIVHGPTVIRNYSVVDRYADLDRSVIWRNCYIGEGAEIRGAIIGRQVSLKRKSVVFEGAVIGDSSVIGEGAIIHPNVKIWPNKEVDAGASVNNSIIWGAQGDMCCLAVRRDGPVNIDLTPEFAARLGQLSAPRPQGAVVTINRDPHRSPRMLKRGVISGCRPRESTSSTCSPCLSLWRDTIPSTPTRQAVFISPVAL